MALNKDILGQALYDMRNQFFNNKTTQELVGIYGSLENARLAACKKEAEIFINHFKNNAVIPGSGLVAGATAVTGAAQIT
jgi:hypothetical protein